MDIIKHRIVLPEYRHEYLIPLAPEIKFSAIESDAVQPAPFAVVVYRVERQISPHEWIYKFSGTQIHNLPIEQRTVSGKGCKVRFANKIISLGWWIANR